MVHVVQIIPWQTPPLLHTVHVSPLSSSGAEVAWMRTVPPDQANKSAGLIELLLVLPNTTSSSTIQISVAIQKKMLGVFEYPTDPSRGIHLVPATVTYIPSSCADTTIASCSGMSQRHSSPIVVPIPIPDFSMYFNVICFTCMPVALLFGGVLNVLFSPPHKIVNLSGVGELQDTSHTSSNSGPTMKERVRRLVAVGMLVGGLAVYLDKDLQRRADHWVQMGKDRYHHLLLIRIGNKSASSSNTEL